ADEGVGEVPASRGRDRACSIAEPCLCFLIFWRYRAVVRFACLGWLMWKFRPALSATPPPGEESPRHCTCRCSGSMNSGRAISVTRGARKISMRLGARGLGLGARGSRQLQLRRGPAGGPFDLAQACGDVIGNRGRVRTDFQV